MLLLNRVKLLPDTFTFDTVLSVVYRTLINIFTVSVVGVGNERRTKIGLC